MLDDKGSVEPRVPDIRMEEMKKLQEEDPSLTSSQVRWKGKYVLSGEGGCCTGGGHQQDAE